MTDQFRNITFPPENDGFFAELREEVNAYFKKKRKEYIRQHKYVSKNSMPIFGICFCFFNSIYFSS